MRLSLTVVLAASMVVFAAPAMADLQNVTVGGELRIRGSYYSSEATGSNGFLFEEDGNSNSFVEQRTKINVRADFTNDVSAFIELDSYDVWGEDFRSDPITGVDNRSVTNNDVEVYQAYIEMREVWGRPLTLRIGRQEVVVLNEWLVGNNDTASLFRGLSFDGVTSIYAADSWTIASGHYKLAETSPTEEDGDVDLHGLVVSYTGLEDINLAGYWIYLRDARGAGPGLPFAFDTNNAGLLPIPLLGISGRVGDALEDALGVDQYSDTTNIHTFGVHFDAVFGAWDLDADLAYQIGDATNTVRTFFQPDPNSSLTGPLVYPGVPGSGAFLSIFGGPYGDDDAEYDAFAVNGEVGYTFDSSYQPRLWIGGAWFEGEDNREDSFGEFLRNLLPFYTQEASVSFNRLFSDVEYSEFLANTDLSNVIIVRGGISAQPTEKIEVSAVVSYFMVDEEFTRNGVFGIPFLGDEQDDTLGLELGLYMTYDYSEDLSFEFGYAHFFADDGVSNSGTLLNGGTRLFGGTPLYVGGNFIQGNGLINAQGVDDDDADYIYAETSIKF